MRQDFLIGERVEPARYLGHENLSGIIVDITSDGRYRVRWDENGRLSPATAHFSKEWPDDLRPSDRERIQVSIF